MEKVSCTRARREQCKAINVQKNVTDDRMMRIRATQGQPTTTGRGGDTHSQTHRHTHTLRARINVAYESIKSLKADNKGPLGLKRAQQRSEGSINSSDSRQRQQHLWQLQQQHQHPS